MRLSKKITKTDAQRAISILKHCLMQVGFDPETGQIDIDRITTGVTASQRNRIGLIREIINDLEKREGKTIPIEEIIKEAGIKDLDEDKVEEVIETYSLYGER